MAERAKDVLTWLVVIAVVIIGLYGALGMYADGLAALAKQSAAEGSEP